jgi:hypothetical protein
LFVANDTMLTTTTTAENKYVHFFTFKKSKWKFVKVFRKVSWMLN